MRDSPCPAVAEDAHAEGMRRNSAWQAALALFLVGVNLRPALSSVAPLLSAIRADTGLSSTGAGLLTTLPVLSFGIFAPLASRLANRLGDDRTVLAGLLALAAALGLRAAFGMAGLFLGTLVAGASIGIISVLLPGIIKREFGRRVSGMMGVYTTSLCLGAALGAGLTVPIERWNGDGWRTGLAFWLLPAVLAAVAWWPRTGRAAPGAGAKPQRVRGLWSSPLAWQVTGFMGLQSSLAYCVFGWLPTILIERGMTPLAAGGMLSLTNSMQLITGLSAPWLAGLGRDQRPAILAMMLMTLTGFVGCMHADTDALWPWAVLLGFGLGGAFSIALTLIVLRAPNAATANALSGMSQGVGYAAAAMGPLAFGLLRDFSHDWHAAAVLFEAVTVAALACGLLAGRGLHVAARIEEGV